MNLLLGGIALTVLVGVVILLIIRFALVAVTVECNSMTPTLESGERVLVWRAWPTGLLLKGQIVIVSQEPVEKTDSVSAHTPFGVDFPYVRRIAALPGDRIATALADLPESLHADYRDDYAMDGWRQWHVPRNHVFVMGDRRLATADSRIWGPIPKECVLGLVIMTLPRRTNTLEADIAHWAYTESRTTKN